MASSYFLWAFSLGYPRSEPADHLVDKQPVLAADDYSVPEKGTIKANDGLTGSPW